LHVVSPCYASDKPTLLQVAFRRHALCISVLADTRTFEDSNQCLSAQGHSAAAAAEWRTFLCAAFGARDLQRQGSTRTRIDAENGHADAAIEAAPTPVARARACRRRGLRDGDSLRGLRGPEAPMVRIPRANAHARSAPRGRPAQARDRPGARVARPPHRAVAG